MKEKRNKKQIAVQVAATALAAALIAGPASNVVYAAAPQMERGITLLAADEQGQTQQKTLYTVGNTSYENNGGTPKGNGHDCQHLGIWVPAGVTFKIRQTNTALGQNLTLKMRNDDRLTEAAYTLKSDGSWLEITPTADSVPLISSVYSAKGELPQVEYTFEGTKELPIYEFGDDELAFYAKWDELDAPFAVYLSEYTIWLVPARDKTRNSVGSLDDLLLWYDNMIRQYNAFSGLTKDAAEPWNKDSGTKYLIKANRHGWGAAYYSVVETAPNGDSLLGYMNTSNWGPLHEVGHGYDTVNFGSAEIWNNVLSHYYQVYALGAGRWLNSSEAGRAEHEQQRATRGYFKTENYGSKLYFWINMLDKLGPQKTSAYAYQLYRGNKANGIANLGGHDFYVDAYTRGSGYNVSAWFDMWGFTVEDSTKQALIEVGAYQNIYPLRNLVQDDATAETIRAALGLVSKYSMVETQELQNYFKSAAAIEGTLSLRLDALAYEVTQGQTIRITDGVNTIREIEITGQDIDVELPIGLYNIIVPSAKGSDLVVLHNRVGYAAIVEGETADFNVTAEKVTASSEFVDWTIRFGSNYSYRGTFCTAATDIANGTMRITTVACSPHTYYYGNTFASIKVYDADGNEVYAKICPGQGTTAEDATIDIRPGYIIEAFHAEPSRGHSVSSSAMGEVKLMNNNQKTTRYEVTEYGLKMLSPEEKSGEENYLAVLSAYMDSLKEANAKADFQNPEKFPEEKVRVNAAVAKLPAEWQTKFEAAYKGYYPFDQGVREMSIAAIPAQDYTGSPVTPTLDITVGSTKLTAADYRTEWTLNTDVGNARVKVYGTGVYEDCIGEASFEIRLPDSLPKEFTVVSEYASVEFSSGTKRPSAKVTIGGKELTRGVDYILAYANNTSVGTATVTANGIGNYAGISGSTTFEITNKIVDMTVTVSPAKVNLDARGAITGVTVMVGKKQLTAGADYTVSYTDNTAVGTATATVTGVGNYDGSVGSATYEVTQPLNPDPIGGTVFSNWRYNMNGYGWTKNYSVMTFDMENSTLTVEHGKAKPHELVSSVYATISVFDTDGSRSYYKEYIGNKNNYQPMDTVKLGLGYIVQLTFSEPEKSGSTISSTASSSVTLKPKTARYLVTERGLQEITADGSAAANDMAANYVTTLRAYMDQLKKNNPVQEDFWDAAKFPEQKAEVEKGVTLLTPEELAQFKEDYAGYYPFAAPASYTVKYDWGTEFPGGETLPADGTTYRTEEAALAAMDTHYTDQSTSNAKKGDLTGSWSFSGWTGKLDGTVVKFTGKWTFTADIPPVDAEAPAAITLAGAEYEEGQVATALDGKTAVTDDGTITYQWYRSNAADDFNGTPIDGETGEIFTPSTDAEGTYHYYVIATNTLASATGSKTASTTSSMATIIVRDTDVPATYSVTYDWGTDFPAGETLPKNDGSYPTEAEARAAVDIKYIAGYAVKGQKDSKDGIWTFSGWTAAVEGTTVKFTGSWPFSEEIPAPVVTPSYAIKAEDTTNGKLTLSASRASRGQTVTVTVTPDEGFTLASLTVRDRNGNIVSVTKTADNKYTFQMPGRAVTVSTEFEAEAKLIQFSDVKESDWYYDAVHWAAKQGVLREAQGNLFDPHSRCTRAEIVLFLYRAAGSPSITGARNPFRDVYQEDDFYDAVLWAVGTGVTKGTGSNEFSPYAAVSKGQAATFLYRLAGSPEIELNRDFSDVGQKAYYAKAVYWSWRNGIADGTGNGQFDPNADCTRAQIVAFIYRNHNRNNESVERIKEWGGVLLF